MTVRVKHLHVHQCNQCSSAARILAEVQQLKEQIMAAIDTLKQEIAEEKAQNEQILTALTGLMAVVQPLIEQIEAGKAALEAANAALQAANAATAELEAQITAAASDLDAGQQALQPAVDAALKALPQP